MKNRLQQPLKTYKHSGKCLTKKAFWNKNEKVFSYCQKSSKEGKSSTVLIFIFNSILKMVKLNHCEKQFPDFLDHKLTGNFQMIKC